jgi:hypothetical protein
MQNQSGMNEELCREALSHFKLGLDQLDQGGAPGDIGAYIDLAICKLQDALAAYATSPVLALKAASGG